MTRREFLRFFLLGGLISFLGKDIRTEKRLQEAMFWKRFDEA